MSNLSISELTQKLQNNTNTLGVIVFHGLAGDCMYLIPPNRKNIMVDCGFHKGEYITDAVKTLPGNLKSIVITHQHLDHFATLGKFAYEFAVEPDEIFHAGVNHPAGIVPHKNLTSCAEYDDLTIPLWHQYHNFIKDDKRWESIDTGCEQTEVVNLLPEKVDASILSHGYGALNYTSTPVGIEYHDHRVFIGSDMNADQFDKILKGSRSSFLDNATLYIPASHGRPHHNPKWVLDKLEPEYICLNDSFPNSDFRGYYTDILPDSDVRACNIDKSQAYIFTPDSVNRYNVVFDA